MVVMRLFVRVVVVSTDCVGMKALGFRAATSMALLGC